MNSFICKIFDFPKIPRELILSAKEIESSPLRIKVPHRDDPLSTIATPDKFYEGNGTMSCTATDSLYNFLSEHIQFMHYAGYITLTGKLFKHVDYPSGLRLNYMVDSGISSETAITEFYHPNNQNKVIGSFEMKPETWYLCNWSLPHGHRQPAPELKDRLFVIVAVDELLFKARWKLHKYMVPVDSITEPLQPS